MENALWSEFWYDLECQFDPDGSPKELLPKSAEICASTPKASLSMSEAGSTNKTTNTQQAGYIRTPTTFAEFAEACSQNSLSNRPKQQRIPENAKNPNAGEIPNALITPADILKPRNRQNRTNEKDGKREKTKRQIKMSRIIDANGQAESNQGTNKLVPNNIVSLGRKQTKNKNLSRNQNKKKRIPNPKQNVNKTSNEIRNNSSKRKRGRSKRKVAKRKVASTSLQPKSVLNVCNRMLLP